MYEKYRDCIEFLRNYLPMATLTQPTQIIGVVYVKFCVLY